MPSSFYDRWQLGGWLLLALPMTGCLPVSGTLRQPTTVVVTPSPAKPVSAQELEARSLPPGATRLIERESWNAERATSTAIVVKPLSQSPLPGMRNLAIITTTVPEHPWTYQLSVPVAQAIQKGDVLFVRFFARAVKGQPETGEGQIGFVVERNKDPFDKAMELELPIPREPSLIEVPFVAATDLPAGEVQVNIRLGYLAQSLELGDIEVYNYGTAVKVTDLPRTRLTYPGSEPDAPWRKAAEARIEKIRKGDLEIRVLDKNGKPASGLMVSAAMQKHAFRFGTAVAVGPLFDASHNGRKYREFLTKHCSAVVIENALKWPNYDGAPAEARKTVAWLREHQLPVRGHNLVWPSWKYIPSSVTALKNNPAALKQVTEKHITETVTAFKGQLFEWDVVNEPYANHDLMDILGRDSMIRWFHLAKKADPACQLYLNDYPPLDGAATSNNHLNHFYNTIAYLKQKKTPIDGFGFQCHFGSSVIPPARLISGLDRFAKFGLPIAITEFDINTTDEELQARYTRDFLTATFSHPAVHEILTWGFWQDSHWIPDAAFYRSDWTLKPNGEAWLDLIKSKWWTNASGTTDALGTYRTRGFYGDYEITVTSGYQIVKKKVNFRKSGTTVTIQL